MQSSKSMPSSTRRALGASTVSIVITLTLLVVGGVGGWVGYTYYQLLDRVTQVEHSLDTVNRYRGANAVTAERIRKNALEKLQGAGGRLEARDVTVQLSALNSTNGQQLPRMMRTKLTMTCHLRKVHAGRVAKIDRPLHPRSTVAPMAPKGPVPPPDLGGGLGCSSAALAELDYTFVRVQAKVGVKRGLFSRTLSITRTFFLPQAPPGRDSDKDSDSDSDSDDE